MRLLKPWKDTQRFYLVFGMVPTLIVTINETQTSSKLLEDLDSKYREDFNKYMARKAEEQLLDTLNSAEKD